MTVEAITRKAGPYDYTSSGQYPFYFKVFAQSDIYVIVTDDDGVETQINADTDYTVTLNDNQDNDAGGYVTLLQDYTGSKITIGSDVPYTQEVIITNKGGFYPDTLNKAYDKLTILCQQNREILDRALKVGISSSVSADEYKGELEGLVNQSVASAASAAASAQQAATDSAQAVSNASTALEQSTTALTQSGTALIQSTTALENSVSAVNSIQPALSAAQQASIDAAEAVDKSEQALSEASQIDDKVEQAVNDAIAGVTIPGLTPETISGALGYTPYDAETNSKDFATNAEVAGAIAAIPEPVNADWNASKGAAAILNKPVLSAVATSGNYADLNGKPALATVATSGSYNDLKDIPQAIPSGFIGMWSGSADAIPSGWWLCNGENGTPDLRDRFIIGAGGSYAAGSAGGNASQTVSLSGQTGATTLTVEQMPSHTHAGAQLGSNVTGGAGNSGTVQRNVETTGYTGGSQPHAHSLTGTADVSILPPYYALCFIMKQ